MNSIRVLRKEFHPPARLVPHPLQGFDQGLYRRTQLRRLLRMLPGQVVLLALEVQRGQGTVGSGVPRIEAHGVLQGGKHSLGLAELGVNHGQKVVRVGQVWGQPYHSAQVGEGGISLSLL